MPSTSSTSELPCLQPRSSIWPFVFRGFRSVGRKLITSLSQTWIYTGEATTRRIRERYLYARSAGDAGPLANPSERSGKLFCARTSPTLTRWVREKSPLASRPTRT